MKHMIQIFMDNQQAAIVLGEKIARDHGVIVDVLNRQEICTIHPPVKSLDPLRVTSDIPVPSAGWADQAIKVISEEKSNG